MNNEDLDLQGAVKSMNTSGEEEWNSDDDDDEESDESNESDYYSYDEGEETDDSEGAQEGEEDENERIIEALSSGVGELKMDSLGNYILE